MSRGFFGIGVYQPKTVENIGTLWRSAHNFGASFIFTIGRRYKKQPTDTTKAYLHVPLYEYISFDEFKINVPRLCDLVFIEQVEGALNIKDVVHPDRACYILGAEDHGIPVNIMKGYQKVFINTPMCLNVSVAGSIVLYDRSIKHA